MANSVTLFPLESCWMFLRQMSSWFKVTISKNSGTVSFLGVSQLSKIHCHCNSGICVPRKTSKRFRLALNQTWLVPGSGSCSVPELMSYFLWFSLSIPGRAIRSPLAGGSAHAFLPSDCGCWKTESGRGGGAPQTQTGLRTLTIVVQQPSILYGFLAYVQEIKEEEKCVAFKYRSWQYMALTNSFWDGI